ncbi:MAG: peptidoglycan DD-metalloendopeptidase family protein [Candidatus Saganbacteria bacterium]|nr:peptidoglycan DD-metalloendopeptidase family protein [Candidatus Saganbacteria bacterium]
MKQKPKRQRYYTFMVVPHDPEGKTFSLRLPLLVVRAAVFLAIFSLFLVGSSFVYSSILSRRLVHYHKAIAANRQQMKVIDDFSQETAKVHQAITELVQEDNELRKLLGLKNWRSKIKLSNKKEERSEQVTSDLVAAEQKIAEKQESLSELKEWVSQVRLRYANTPSRWPLYGRIVSRFGYRIYPWRGFHTGLDISGLYGAPIRVTANGYVSFAGWRRGYGRTVVVNHGFGKSTLYAHCSRFTVQQGQQVSKGQVIAYVGNTGYTTGPHLHYEVRENNKPVNPVAYLDLNILTASKIWRR